MSTEAGAGGPLLRFLPGVRTVSTYQRAWLPKDVVAGVVLATLCESASVA